MDFFETQDRARRKTGLLIAYFVLAVVLIIAAVYLVAVLIFSVSTNETRPRTGSVRVSEFDRREEGDRATALIRQFWHPELLLLAAAGTVAVISLGSGYKILQLRGGGEVVATSLGGKRIHPNTTDPAERQLLNVVEEMALASGVPVPAVFLLDGEKSINAFAAGYSPGDAVIGVNRGTIEYLNRDELQGVIAHEFSHILNGDMRLNIRLIGILNGILILALIGFYLMRAAAVGSHSSRRGKGGGGQLILFGLALLVIGYLGVFFARLIQAAVSRQREYLADASAVQFTRNPDGIGGGSEENRRARRGFANGDTRSTIGQPHVLWQLSKAILPVPFHSPPVGRTHSAH